MVRTALSSLVLLLCAATLTAQTPPLPCDTFAGLAGSMAVYHFSMGEFSKWAVPGNTIESVYKCKLPFQFEDDEKVVVYVKEPPGGEPNPTPYGDVMVLAGGFITLYSDPSESIDNYRTVFDQQPTPANTVTEIGTEGDNHFTYVQFDATGHQFADYYIVSDSPEPQSLILVGAGLALLFFGRRLARRVKL